LGKKLLHRDIRHYGDHNPGAANVFKAGSIGLGFLAVFLDIVKGFPFVFISYTTFDFHEVITYLIGLSAISGHAFSPFLNFKGGKAYAVTLGVLLALPQRDILMVLMLFLVIGFLLWEGDGWRTTIAVFAMLVYSIISSKSIWFSAFLGFIVALIAFKNLGELRYLPERKKKIYIGFGRDDMPESGKKAG
jgi:glycerol-3-phosphate acyltransferase PlsY